MVRVIGGCRSAFEEQPRSVRSLLESEEAVVAAVSYVLTEQCARNTEIVRVEEDEDDRVTIFHADEVAAVTIPDYLQRIAIYSGGSPVCFLAAMIYLDRIHRPRADGAPRELRLTALNIHRFLIAAFLCAVKFFDDQFYKNSYYAAIGGVSLQEMNELELEFLTWIQYRLFISKEEFDRVARRLISKLMLYRDEHASHVQRLLIRTGCVRTYSLYGGENHTLSTDGALRPFRSLAPPWNPSSANWNGSTPTAAASTATTPTVVPIRTRSTPLPRKHNIIGTRLHHSQQAVPPF